MSIISRLIVYLKDEPDKDDAFYMAGFYDKSKLDYCFYGTCYAYAFCMIVLLTFGLVHVLRGAL